ncbi:tetratricopeptide repeat protein [Belnapia sp. T6]|uniref:Tetratricopeptide repeat protein 38 n=1 Tax=Belnapia mucosa TaxID=2804532 RepID=A0ABS1V072_9PROT|nr:tetratricopeptide repeat protein [Belnapia mucosa]MBL6454962.1 tetratricopeptide repeat protein [Belnapia mucosa]
MFKDAQGLPLTAASAEAASGYDHSLNGFLLYRADTAQRLKAAMTVDPEAPMLQVMKGSFAMLTNNRSLVPVARDAAVQAGQLAALGTAREKAHVAALSAWVEGDMTRALAAWTGILAENPHDLLALRLHHYNAFWRGRPDMMLAAVQGVLPRWGADQPGYGNVLACQSFAHEECGLFIVAEAAGRAAVALNPADLWATHAVAHVMEMQGRRGEGIAWTTGLEQHWEGGNNLTHHLWWHRALFHLERGETGQVLELYDRRFRNLESPVTQVMPDLAMDMQNAISMLFRLKLQGVDGGRRWEELADKAEARIGDCQSGFTLPHWMMALTATGRFGAAERMLEAIRAHAGSNSAANAPAIGRYALPICDAVLRHARGDYAGAVAVMRPTLGGMHLLGGSHAQQDLLEQFFLDSAMRAGLAEDARMLLERVAGRHPVPPERRAGYAKAARSVLH